MAMHETVGQRNIAPWPFTGIGLIVLAIVLFAAPGRFEGRVVVPISPGHGLSVLDAVALVPLLIGQALVFSGLWARRTRLSRAIQTSPGLGSLGVFTAGVGLGLMIASVISLFFWWWAVGAVLLAVMMIVTTVVATR